MDADPNAPADILHERVLGIRFFVGTVQEAIAQLTSIGGYIVIPAAPALIKLRYDEEYRHAMESADLAIADSGLLAVLWKLTTGRRLTNISGITYLRHLVDGCGLANGDSALCVLASSHARNKAVEWLRAAGIPVDEDNFYIASQPTALRHGHALLLKIEEKRPRNIVIAMPGSGEENLALYLREYLLYRPCIHCVGAGLGFLSGAERPIPHWAERAHLGWLIRILAQPRMFFPRIGIALALIGMVLKYGSELPPLRQRWADL
jgi:UDP-N-acetyl-D-mannosaminuronic acid transferase (WecB/TagA/CpsF family)